MVKTWGKPVIAQTSSGDLNRITSVLRPAGVTVERQKSGRRLIFGYPVHSKGGGAERRRHARGARVERHVHPSLNEHHWRIIDETW